MMIGRVVIKCGQTARDRDRFVGLEVLRLVRGFYLRAKLPVIDRGLYFAGWIDAD